MKIMWMMFVLCGLLATPMVSAQKVVMEGEDGALKAQMELYARRTKSETMKAMYASYAEPEEFSDFSVEQFKQIYEEQLKEMYRVVDGKLIPVKAWNIPQNFVGAPSAKLIDLESAAYSVPRLYRVQILNALGDGLYVAKLSSNTGGQIGRFMVQFDPAAEPYSKHTVLEAYLVQAKVTEAIRQKPHGLFLLRLYQLVPDEVGQAVHEPTLKEMATAIKEGLRPLVFVPTASAPCSTCKGSGIDHAKIAAAEASADREAHRNRLGKTEVTYNALGKRRSNDNDLAPSKAFNAAKLRLQKPKCQQCGGDGRRPCNVFRTLKR